MIINLIPLRVLSQELDEIVENAVINSPEVQLLEKKIEAIENKIKEYPPLNYSSNPLINKLQSILFYFSPVYKLQQKQNELREELSAVKFGIQENTINSH
ncbi:hypothetical protein GM3709_696 [Geminocystis sp. NIES-3709]|nr:hypothetical protein GM3709_696 [Geminocystis sp. NIES-3709]